MSTLSSLNLLVSLVMLVVLLCSDDISTMETELVKSSRSVTLNIYFNNVVTCTLSPPTITNGALSYSACNNATGGSNCAM